MGDRNTKDSNLHKLFKRMHSQYCGRIYNLVMSITGGNSYMAEEVTQMVFMKFWEKIETLDTSDDLKNYLFAIARNTLIDMLRHETIEYIYINYLRPVHEDESVMQGEIDATFLETYVARIVDEMPPQRRQVFQLSRMEYMSNKEIAERLGISVNTVENHLVLALKYIRTELKRRYGIMSLIMMLANAFCWI